MTVKKIVFACVLLFAAVATAAAQPAPQAPDKGAPFPAAVLYLPGLALPSARPCPAGVACTPVPLQAQAPLAGFFRPLHLRKFKSKVKAKYGP